jgi:hypothetical protein
MIALLIGAKQIYKIIAQDSTIPDEPNRRRKGWREVRPRDTNDGDAPQRSIHPDTGRAHGASTPAAPPPARCLHIQDAGAPTRAVPRQA